MSTSPRSRSRITLITAALALAACAEAEPLAVDQQAVSASAMRANPADLNRSLSQLRSATARYHNVAAALKDGYIPVGECEVHEGEAPGGIPYANIEYLTDGVIDPSKPDALLYEPVKNGKLRLVGVELAVPYPMWTEAQPPEFFGHVFRPEDEMGVFGLHVWVWRSNPDGMFAWGNARVSCGEES